MFRISLSILALGLLSWAGQGCLQTAPADPNDTSVSTDDTSTPPRQHHRPLYMQEDPLSAVDVEFQYDGVDILFVVDNSLTMIEEEGKLAAASFTLLSALQGAPDSWPYPPVDNVRVGVTTSDLGLAYGSDFTLPDGVSIVSCEGRGDDGRFIAGFTEDLLFSTDAIPCWGSTSECPTGWSCEVDASETQGACSDDSGFNSISCAPSLDQWVQTDMETSGELNAATVAACMTHVSGGDGGCGMEQPLRAPIRTLERNGDFLRPNALLAVIVVTDEDDCSFEDPAVFETPEVVDRVPFRLNVLCPLHEDLLVDVAELRETLVDFKGGDDRGVLFGLIAGVPLGDDCEGGGHRIGSCLDVDSMQFVEEVDAQTEFVIPRPSCETVVDETTTSSATPPRRSVALVQEFEEYGYAYSICADDFHNAALDLSKQILRAMQPFDPMTSE